MNAYRSILKGLYEWMNHRVVDAFDSKQCIGRPKLLDEGKKRAILDEDACWMQVELVKLLWMTQQIIVWFSIAANPQN